MSRDNSPARARSRSNSPARAASVEAKLYVGIISYDTKKFDLEDAFGKFGRITDAFVPEDRNTGRPKGFGFITFETTAEAEDAIKAMNETDFMGRTIRVNMAQPKRDDGPRRDFGDRGGGRGGYGGDRGGYGGDRGGYGGDRGGRGGYGGDRGGYGGDRGGYGGDRPRGGGGKCFAHEKGECTRGDSCRFSHD